MFWKEPNYVWTLQGNSLLCPHTYFFIRLIYMYRMHKGLLTIVHSMGTCGVCNYRSLSLIEMPWPNSISNSCYYWGLLKAWIKAQATAKKKKDKLNACVLVVFPRLVLHCSLSSVFVNCYILNLQCIISSSLFGCVDLIGGAERSKDDSGFP